MRVRWMQTGSFKSEESIHPTAIRRAVADLVLRMVVLTVGAKYTLAVCKERDFMWSKWTPRNHNGVSRGRFLLNPCWQPVIVENDATTTDGYAYRFYEY